MYEIFRNVIARDGYDDLNRLLERLRGAWARGLLTDAELDELTAAAKGNGPVKRYDLAAEIDRLWGAVRALQAPVQEDSGDADSGGEETGEAAPAAAEFVQPSGAHDAYRIGDRVSYGGAVYESLIDGNVWAPDVYPAGWRREEPETETDGALPETEEADGEV